jgi:general secretion pathway protein H
LPSALTDGLADLQLAGPQKARRVILGAVRSVSSGLANTAFRRGRRSGSGRRSSAGFTLIELLVAMIIAAVVISMVAISGTHSPARELETDADRLAQLLALAREEAQVQGSPIRFETDGINYQFVVFRDSEWRVIDDDTYLRPRRWSTRTDVQVRRADGARYLEFGRDLVEAPYQVRMLRGEMVAEISANGLGTFEVVRR